jgi:glucose/arabinose dehydrogenase
MILTVGTAGGSTVSAAAPSMTPAVVQAGLRFPWDVAFTPDGEMLVTERGGRVRVFASGAVEAQELLLDRPITIPAVLAQGEAGLMGIAVDIDYATNRFVYVCASRSVSGQAVNQVLRYTVAPDLSWTAETVLLSGMRATVRHNGCALEMDRFGKLWITMGDASDDWTAQDPTSLNGKVLRINRDGSIPADNPQMSDPQTGQPLPRSAVYSMGHRNPQGIAFQPGTDRVYVAEHGPNRDDEVNLILPGHNYGWPCWTGADNQHWVDPDCGPATDYTPPAWTSGPSTIATSGLAFVDGSPWADWNGRLFVSQLKESDLRRFVVSGDGATVSLEDVHFDGMWGRLRAATRGPAGQLYVTTSNGTNDRVIRVSVTTPSVGRLAGLDRYATAAAISHATTAQNPPVVYVATGADFPDALTGGAAAAHQGGPLLLVKATSIPAATHNELTWLKPQRIVVLGGSGVISDGVLTALGAYTEGPVTRVSGADRYETAAAVATAAFSPNVPAAFVATGATFADALAGVPAAAHQDAPLLLTRRTSLPAATVSALQHLKPAQIYVLGGPGAVSDGVVAALDGLTAGSVTRLAGIDRYATAAAAAGLWEASNAAYLATGTNFPDGIAAGAAAGRADVPLLLVKPTAVPTVTGQAIIRLHPTVLTIAGGTGVVSTATSNDLRSLLATP